MNVNLWPFQEEAKHVLRQNILQGVRRQILCSPTGSGKTEIAMSIVNDVVEKGNRCMFVVDRQTLVRQTAQRFARAGIDHGMVMGNDTYRVHAKALVCSAQTLESRGCFDTLPKPDLVFFDECHEIRKALVNAAKEKDLLTIGLSATPLSLGLDQYYETIVNTTTTQELIGNGYLAPLKVIGPRHSVIDTQGLAVNSGEWNKKQLSSRVLRIVGQLVPMWKEKTKQFFGGPVQTIVFCPSVPDSQKTAESFRAAGYDFEVVHYKQSSKQKQEIIERFRREKHVGLVSCVALTKGFDVPGTRCMVDAYPLRSSLAMHVQKLGRVMRKAEGKEFGLVIDHAENFTRFYEEAAQFFEKGCEGFVTERKKKRKKGKKELQVADRTCLECEIVLQPTEYKCPECGKERLTKRDESIMRVNGQMDVVAELIGQKRMDELPNGDDEGWWWKQICIATAVKIDDPSRARKRALAVYRNTFGKWPTGSYQHLHDRSPHPHVLHLLDRSYQRWIQKQK